MKLKNFFVMTLFSAVVLFILLCVPLPAQEVLTRVVAATGSAVIQDNDTAKAKDAAITNSIIAAIDQTALSLFPIDRFTADFKGISKILRDKKDQFVQSYRILAETRTEKVMSVLMEVTVLPEVIRSSVRFVEIKEPEQDTRFPKIVFLISEKDIGNPVPRFWWGKDMASTIVISEGAITASMTAKGFSAIDHRQGIPDLPSGFVNKADLNESDAAEIGKRMNAEVVVFGKAMVYESYKSNEQTNPSFSGTLAVHALRTETGEIMTSAVRTILSPSPDEALISVGNMAGEDIAAKLTELWKKDTPPHGMLKIVVGGTNFLTNLVAFRRMLSAMPDVSDVQTTEMTMDKAILMVAYTGNPENLSEELILKNFDAFAIQMNEISRQQLTIELVPK